MTICGPLSRSRTIDSDTCSVSTTNSPPAPGIDLAAYRLVQEGLTNARKHAKATRVNIRIAIRDGSPTIAIEDDGVGFDLATESRRARRGPGDGAGAAPGVPACTIAA